MTDSKSSEKKKNRRSLLALLGGAAGFGIAQKAAAQQPSTLSNMPYASTPLGGGELTYVVQGGISKKTPISSITGAALPGGSSGQLQFNNAGAFGGYGVGSGLSVVGGNLVSTASVTGLPAAATIATLSALNPSIGQAYLTDPVRGGNVFIWNTGSHTIQVANDPGQGVYVATATDPTGASGAWVRQYTGPASIGWWGAIGDAVITFPIPFAFPTIVSGTDNAQALANWGTWARHQSSLDIPVIMMTPPPTGNGYLFNSSNCTRFAAAVKKLIWYNNKALWQNTSSSTSNPWSDLASPMIRFVGPFISYNWKINQTQPGAFGFSMINATDAFVPAGSFVFGSAAQPYTIQSLGNTNWTAIGAGASPAVGTTFVATGAGSGTGVAYNAGFQVGSWVMVASLDVQYGGAPPNLQQFEFVKIDGITTYPAAAVSTATYQNNNGLLILTFAAGPYASAPVGGSLIYKYLNGITATVSGLTGSGVSSLNANWTIQSVSPDGLTVILQVPTGLGTLTIGGGTLGPNTIVQIEQSLRYEHRTDFPDMVTQVPFYTAGAARIWALDTGPITINGIVYPVVSWDTDQEWHDLKTGFSQIYQYWSFSGKRISTFNYEGAGDSPTVSRLVHHQNPTFLFPGEPDKNVEAMTYEGVDFYNGGDAPSSPQGPMGFQSPNDRLTIRNSKITALTTATTKSVYVENCDIGQLSVGGNLGFSSSQIYIGCRIFSGGPSSLIDGGSLLPIDGTNVAFGTAGGGAGSVAGVLTLLKTGFPSGAQNWNAVMGMTVCLTGPSGVYTGSTLNAVNGAGIIFRLYEDSTYLYIVTSLPFTTLPAWANGTIWFFRNGGMKFIRCTGCDSVRQASAAFDKGLDYWNYKQFILGGPYASPLSYVATLFGNLTKVTVTPLQIGSAPGATATMTFVIYNSASSFASVVMTIAIVVGIAGQRVITQGVFTNPQTGDSVIVNSINVTSTGLPTGYVIAGRLGAQSLQVNTSGATNGPTTSPMYEVELELDSGICRKVFPTNFDSGVNLAFATTGLLP